LIVVADLLVSVGVPLISDWGGDRVKGNILTKARVL